MFQTLIRGQTVFKDLTTSFNGQILEELLKTDDGFFKTIKVEGRGLMDEQHDVIEVPGRSGSYYRGRRFKSRTIEVTGHLKANNDTALRRQYSRLGSLLSTDQPVWLAFSDDDGLGYFAKFEQSDKPEERKSEVIIKLTFTCHDPFKYSDIKEVTGEQVTYAGQYPSKPIVSLTLDKSDAELRLLHVESQRYIRLLGKFAAGQTVKVDMATGAITLNGRNILSQFDMVNSRYFELLPGANTLSSNLSGNWQISYREVYL